MEKWVDTLIVAFVMFALGFFLAYFMFQTDNFVSDCAPAVEEAKQLCVERCPDVFGDQGTGKPDASGSSTSHAGGG